MSMKSVIFLPFVVDLGIVAKCVVDPAVTQITFNVLDLLRDRQPRARSAR